MGESEGSAGRGRGMGGYPAEIIGAYRRGETTRAEFLSALGAWQRGRGRYFRCRGVADAGGLYLIYRGRCAVVEGGKIRWHGTESSSAFEWRRRVDFSERGGAA